MSKEDLYELIHHYENDLSRIKDEIDQAVEEGKNKLAGDLVFLREFIIQKIQKLKEKTS